MVVQFEVYIYYAFNFSGISFFFIYMIIHSRMIVDN